MADEILADIESSGIYEILCVDNGRRYVGSAVCIRKRWHVHRHLLRSNKHHSKYLQRSWNKRGEGKFCFRVIETCDKNDLIAREQHWINKLSPEYNMSPTAGSCLGVKHSAETRRHRSEINMGNKFCVGRIPSDKCRKAVAAANRRRKGIKRSAEAVEKTASAHRGMKRSEETRKKISLARKGTKMPPRTASHCANISRALKGKKKSDQVMQALQDGRKNRVYTEDQRKHLSEIMRRRWEDDPSQFSHSKQNK